MPLRDRLPSAMRGGRRDLTAGVVLGVESIPAGLAGGLLAGVDPLFGLYGYLVGTVTGALTTSSALMIVQGTGAMAVVVVDVPSVHGDTADAHRALFTLSVLTGLCMLGLGLARAGGAVRWVPHSVLAGFINAVAVTIVLGQLATLTGYAGHGSTRPARAANTVWHVADWSGPTFTIGALTVALIVVLGRTRLGPLGLVVAVVGASAVAALPWFDGVPRVRDIASIAGLPTPALPDPSLVGGLLVPALSLAFVGLVQGAAISRSVPNPDGRYPDPSGDFRGQGLANVAAGVLQGIPVGGSMSATAITAQAGARSRLAGVVAAAVMAGVILVVPSAAGAIAMPALAGLLITVGVGALKPDDVRMVWHTGPTAAVVMVSTFVLTLVIPLQYAVLAGIGASVLLHLLRQGNRIVVVRSRFGEDGRVVEEEPPPVLAAREVVVLRPYGSLFFATAPVFEAKLPDVTAASHGAVVIVSLRGTEELGSTFIDVLTRYARRLRQVGGRLMLTGSSSRLRRQLERTGAIEVLGADNVLEATPEVGGSTRRALRAARAATARHRG